jgi:Tol biopolymer transport system component
LKPANILVSKSGVKLLDFGLAKASEELSANLTTIGGPTTGAGTIIGTLQYMSPEQVEGKTADVRSDIFAFGLVLYELVTGKRVFDGASPPSVMASILKDQPRPMSELRPLTPKGLDRVVRTCLEKDPDKRWQSARDVKHALDLITLDTADRDRPGPAKATARSLRLWQGAAVVALLGAVGAFVWASRPAPAATPEAVRFQVAPPSGTAFGTYVALAPNGQQLAFTAVGADGIVRLWVRDLTRTEPRMLAGTDGAQSAFWSPDSRYIAFGFNNQLKKIDVGGGPPQTLCEVANPVGSGAWSRAGIIVFGSRGVGGLNRVAESGGAPTLLTSPEGGFSSFPSFLPDGQHFVYFRRGPVRGIFAGSVDAKPEGQPATPVLIADAGGAYVSTSSLGSGHMLFIREGTMMVQPFNGNTLTFSGEAVAIDRVATVNQYPVFSASANGRLAYRPGGPPGSEQLTWFNRDGKVLGTVGAPGAHEQLALSPDGTRAAYRDTPHSIGGDLWVMDLSRGVSTRLTSEGTLGGFPAWSPDGKRIAFRSGSDLLQKASDGTGDASILLRAPVEDANNKDPNSWSGDGQFLLFTMVGANTFDDIWILPTQGNNRQAVPFLQTQYSESQGRLSPDGRWVAYTSNESGRSEVYVRPFTPPGATPSLAGGKWQVSREGGNSPVWREDGRELIFRSALPGAVMAVEVTPTPTTFAAGIPKLLFATPSVPLAVTGDAKRFLISMPPTQVTQAPITVVLNWEAALKR